jgi:hypothetical protein
VKRSLSISVVEANALCFESDVLILKFAQELYGLDAQVSELLGSKGISLSFPDVNSAILVNTIGILASKSVLFVGVKHLREFGYPEIRNFARTALRLLVREAPTVHRVAFTIHGPGYGLDEIEAFESQVAGIADAANAGEFPPTLESIVFVEMVKKRADRLSASLAKLLPAGTLQIAANGVIVELTEETRDTLRSVGYSSSSKPHVFVAMPFAPEMDDIFYYGIQGATKGAGLLCERADLSAFTGDVMEWVKNRIATAKLVVADLSSCNPNVYLEVGYAWGCRVPTVLLAHQVNDLKFDVKGQRCIIYTSIRHLEEMLRRELEGLQL